MHLAAGSDPGNPIGRIVHLLYDAPNTKDDSFPPNPWTLLGPREPGDDLRILLGGESDDSSGFAHQGNSRASGSNVDRKQEIFYHEGRQRESLKESRAG
jgi:hypothetical protein